MRPALQTWSLKTLKYLNAFLATTLFLSLLIERVPTSTSILTCVVTPDFFQTWPFSTKRRNSYFFVTPKCHYLVNVTLWQIYIFIPLDPWLFLKVLNKVISQRLYKPKLFLIIDLLPSRSQNSWSYELLIIVCLKGGSFLFLGCWSSPMFWLLYNLHGCALPRSWVG